MIIFLPYAYISTEAHSETIVYSKKMETIVVTEKMVTTENVDSIYIPEHRIVHFDLKGAPPSIDYMKKVVTMSAHLGATGVLIEYEDMFPWTGR